jgi:hypothetical protein
MRWVGHVARIWLMRNAYTILVESVNGKYHSEGLSFGGRCYENGF